ncbi:hypothetical protein Q1695_009359 [Nippostrongylus brasiliensis]|nr:hypothetical protein Q1695_009359 [Nippostrongylus brasiliensis]
MQADDEDVTIDDFVMSSSSPIEARELAACLDESMLIGYICATIRNGWRIGRGTIVRNDSKEKRANRHLLLTMASGSISIPIASTSAQSIAASVST